MPTKFFEHKNLFKSINRMARSGGKLQKASDRIRAIRSKIQLSDKDPFHGVAMTNYGKSRIDRGFGYTMYARGLSGKILNKLEDLVPDSGRSRTRDGKRVRWNCVGQLLKNMQTSKKEKRPGHIFGPRSDKKYWRLSNWPKADHAPLPGERFLIETSVQRFNPMLNR